MTQFRIKHIDQGEIDEWVPRINEDGIILGDDIDARDPNELSEAIIDTQDVLLKVSTLSPTAILDPASGIAERLTILESIAGDASLQDGYVNGNTINVTAGSPLIFGVQEEFKLDSAGNLSFNPISMRVKGTGSAFVELTNGSIFSSLGDLLISSSTPGTNLTAQSAGEFYLKDTYLGSPITLSETGNGFLNTTSQSIVGSINELLAASSSDSLQVIYDQSTPATITTALGPGPVQIVDPIPSSLADAFKVTGNVTITKKLSLDELAVGSNTAIQDGVGILTSEKIETSTELRAPLLNSDIDELTFQDLRLSLNLTDGAVSSIDTSSQSIVGAINELKADLDSVGGALTVFDQEHNPSTGEHTIITTQADAGQSSTKRLIVKDDLAAEQFSVTGAGDVIANEITVSGLDVVSLLTDLSTHLSDDGTAHAAVAAHLVASNPHNTVGLLQGLNGTITFTSLDSSITIGTAGNTINLQTTTTTDLQNVYDNSVVKELDLAVAGLRFNDALSTNLLMIIRESDIMFQRNLNLEFFGAKIEAISDLTVEPSSKLTLTSTSDDTEVKTQDANRAVILQGVPFDQVSIKTLPTLGGTSVLGNLKLLDEDKSMSILNGFSKTFQAGEPVTIDEFGLPWNPVTTVHPGNEFEEASFDFFFSNMSGIMVAGESVASAATGKFFKEGTVTSSLPGAPDSWTAGSDIYIGKTGYSEWEITNLASMANLDTVTIDPTGANLVLTAVTGVPALGEFKIESTGNANIDSDDTRSNIVSMLNNTDFMELGGANYYMRATIDGETARGAFTIDVQPTIGNSVTVAPNAGMPGNSVTLTAVADTATPGYLEWRAGLSPEEAAYNLAEALNRTTFFSDAAGTTDGHFCFARASGTVVRLEWYKPGLSANEIVLSDNTGNISNVAFAGGDCKIRVYRQDIGGAVQTVTSSNLSALTASTMSQDESPVKYILEDRAKASSRRTENETSYRVGSIEQAAGSIVKYKIRQE